MLRLIAAAALILIAGCAGDRYRDTSIPMATAEAVDLTRYAGRWYEIARFPVWFQEGCEAVTADYALRPDGLVDVLNTCARDGGTDTAAATARSVDPSNARLKVRFSRWIPIEGDYWIVLSRRRLRDRRGRRPVGFGRLDPRADAADIRRTPAGGEGGADGERLRRGQVADDGAAGN